MKVGSSMATTTAIATCRSYIFCGRYLLGTKLRGRQHRSLADGAVDEVARIVACIRALMAEWGEIVLRGDSGFSREELMAWCEAEGIAYLFGLAPNARMKAVLDPEAWDCSAVVPNHRSRRLGCSGILRNRQRPGTGR